MQHDIGAIVGHLVGTRQPFSAITAFSSLPGIYAVFCTLDRLPLIDEDLRSDEIIYIGKTESSQVSRDAKTHFADGRTGSSTLRRTLGALLRVQFNLKPIPRNATDAAKGKFSHYRFDDESEAKLTRWMKENFALSFYECNSDRSELGSLETQLIENLVPKLNIDKNPTNPYRKLVMSKRKESARLAHGLEGKSSKPVEELTGPPKQRESQYRELWKHICSRLEPAIERGTEEIELQLNSADFEAAGNRKEYRFNLEFTDGRVSNNIKGSAVARHLAEVVIGSACMMDRLSSGHWKFRLDSGFCLHVTKSP